MRGKTNIYDLYFADIINGNTANETLLESNFTASNGLTYQYYKDQVDNWELVILTSGTITFNKNFNADIWMVGGGNNGGDGWFASGTAQGGDGGNGGQCLYSQINIQAGVPYNIVIGGNNSDTTAFDLTARGGQGFKGGNGSYVIGTMLSRTPGTSGTSSLYYAFYDQGTSHFYPNVKFGAGGGGGAACGYHPTQYNVPDTGASHSGGTTGGGSGGGFPDYVGSNGSAGTDHYGAGGGGGGAARGGVGIGGTGGTGIIILHSSDFECWGNRYYIIRNGKIQHNLSMTVLSQGYYEESDGSGYLNLQTNGNHAAVLYTTNPINLTNYTKLYIELSSGNRSWYNANGCPGMHLGTGIPTVNDSSGATSNTTHSVNFASSTSSFGAGDFEISFNVSGSYYPSITVSGTQQFTPNDGYLHIKNWWLE